MLRYFGPFFSAAIAAVFAAIALFCASAADNSFISNGFAGVALLSAVSSILFILNGALRRGDSEKEGGQE
jgi:hypothetical protein